MKFKPQAMRYAHASGAKRFQYIGGKSEIWRFVFSDGRDELKTGDELESQP